MELQNNFQKISPWLYGTRDNIPSLYKQGWFVNEVITESVPNYVMIGHVGHGINSYAIHFYLVLDNLALFIQIEWGGVYMDNDLATQNIEVAFEQATQLIDAMKKRQEDGTLPQNKRLVVVESDINESRWGWIDQKKNIDNEIKNLWSVEENALSMALKAVLD